MFLRNSWYAAAWDREVGRAPLARTLLNDPILFYRRDDGTPVALEDRCCHRHVPLSKGTIEGDDVRCGYHGLRFDPAGICVEIPGQASIPHDARIRSYPVVERWNLLWIWMGDPARADKAAIPDWWWCDHPDWTVARPDMLYVKCNYQLINDNVLDVTHLVYVHANSIGNKAISEFPVTTEREENLVRMSRMILDRPPPPLYRDVGNFKSNVDRWQIVEHTPPSFTVNKAGCAELGTGGFQAPPDKRIDVLALSAPTPETENSTHYFFCFPRAFRLDDPAMDPVFYEEFVRVFKEDVTILEAQQHALEARSDRPQVNIKVDAAPMAARRLLAEMIAAEQRAALVPAS